MEKKLGFILMFGWLPATISFSHQLDQRIGGYSSSGGESRSMAKINGRADVPAMASGEVQSSLSINATIEGVSIEGAKKMNT